MNAAIRGIKGKRVIDLDRPDCDVRGPTLERMAMAQGSAAVGDDKMGRVVYQFLDSPLDRLYGRLVRASRTENATERLRVEYAALKKYHRLFVESGMVGSVGSVDPNRTYSPNPVGRTFLGGSEKQCNDRDEYRRAKICLGHLPGIVVDNVVCSENSLELAGNYVYGKNSQRRRIVAAEKILRQAAFKLAELWKMA